MNFTEQKLSSLCRPDAIGVYGIPASAEEYDVSKVRYLRITDISEDGTLLDNDKKSVSSPDIEKYILHENDLVIARTGNSTGKAYLYNENDGVLAFAGFLIKFGLDPLKVNPEYLRYYTISSLYKDWVNNTSLGSTRGNMNAQTMADCVIRLPERKQQDILVKILSTLDRKISLNRRMNVTLEAMAKQLYDYWFVQFDFPNEEGKPYKSSGGKMVWNEKLKREIPEGWEVKELSTLGSFKNGINYDKSEVGDHDFCIVNVRDVSASSLFIDSSNIDKICLKYEKAKAYLVKEGDILITRSGNPGATRICMDPNRDILFCGFIICYTPNDITLSIYITMFLKEMELQIKKLIGGSIMPNISQESLKPQLIIVPDEGTLTDFNSRIENIFGKIKNNITQISTLTHLRDYLLPLLMNGQVTIKD